MEKMRTSLHSGVRFTLRLLLIEIEVGLICQRVNCLLSKLVQSSAFKVSRDFCNMEIFNVTCRDKEVIIIDSARYGRMSVGRCVTGNYGYLGCAVDTRRLLEEKCSGRQHCRFQVPDKTMYEMRPCPVDFTSYLEVSYFCLPVAVANRSLCEAHQPLKLTESTAFISNVLSMERGLGAKECPWLIEGQQGQTINITLYNFGYSDRYDMFVHEAGTGPTRNQEQSPGRPEGRRNRPEVCFEMAVLTDRELRKTLTLCDSYAGEPVVTVSKWHQVRLEFTNRKLMGSLGGAFLIHYQVIGCPELRLADDMTSHYASKKSHLVVQCNASSTSWQLTCRGSQWEGKIGNCSTPTLSSAASGEDWNIKHIFPADEPFPYGLLLAVSVGVTVGIIVGGLLLCIVTVYVKRYTKTPSGGYAQPEEQYISMNHPYPVRPPSRCQCPLTCYLSSDRRSAYDPDLCAFYCSQNATRTCHDITNSRQHVLVTAPGHENTCCRQEHLLTTNPSLGSAGPHQHLSNAGDCPYGNARFSLEAVADNCNGCGSKGGLGFAGLDAYQSQHTPLGRPSEN